MFQTIGGIILLEADYTPLERRFPTYRCVWGGGGDAAPRGPEINKSEKIKGIKNKKVMLLSSEFSHIFHFAFEKTHPIIHVTKHRKLKCYV